MKQYHDLLQKILDHGEKRPDRTGTGTLSLFGEQIQFDLSEGFPLVTTKKVHFKSVAAELLWMLSGSTNVKLLNRHGVTIWDEWAGPNGELGPVYGHQWRHFGEEIWSDCSSGEDQILSLILSLQDNPFSRRHIVSAWSPNQLEEQALPPCHLLFQFYVSKDNRLSCHMYQRSCDAFLGLPFNIASYALLTMMLCKTHGFAPGRLVISFGDVHLYKNHIEQTKLQLTREPFPFPTVEFLDFHSILTAKLEDIKLVNYKHHPAIKAEVSV